LRLIAKGSGVGERGKARDIDRIGSALDAWIGTWTKREANAVLDSVRSLEQVDPDLWT
jgi:hypothetical protein